MALLAGQIVEYEMGGRVLLYSAIFGSVFAPVMVNVTGGIGDLRRAAQNISQVYVKLQCERRDGPILYTEITKAMPNLFLYHMRITPSVEYWFGYDGKDLWHARSGGKEIVSLSYKELCKHKPMLQLPFLNYDEFLKSLETHYDVLVKQETKGFWQLMFTAKAKPELPLVMETGTAWIDPSTKLITQITATGKVLPCMITMEFKYDLKLDQDFFSFFSQIHDAGQREIIRAGTGSVQASRGKNATIYPLYCNKGGKIRTLVVLCGIYSGGLSMRNLGDSASGVYAQDDLNNSYKTEAFEVYASGEYTICDITWKPKVKRMVSTSPHYLQACVPINLPGVSETFLFEKVPIPQAIKEGE
jgi:hypothetical protein